MKGCLSTLICGVGVCLILGGIGGLADKSHSDNSNRTTAIVMIAVGAIIIAAASRRKKQPAGPKTQIDVSVNIAEKDPVLQRIDDLGKAATAKKKTDPDGALRILAEIERLQREIPMHPKVILDTRLRMATTLYENGRFDEAEKFLLAELAAARRMKISKATVAEADRRYRERMESLKIDQEISGEAPKDFELLRSFGEWPDFERNLYCLAIYAKLKTLYTKMRRHDQALVFALAEAYAKYENATHNECRDDPAPDFTAVDKILHKLGRDADSQQWRDFLLGYAAPEPTCEGCWAMIDAARSVCK